MKVIGIKRYDIDNKFHGYQYFVTEEQEKVAGLATDSFFVSDNILKTLTRDIALEDEVLPVYKKNSKYIHTVIIMG